MDTPYTCTVLHSTTKKPKATVQTQLHSNTARQASMGMLVHT